MKIALLANSLLLAKGVRSPPKCPRNVRANGLQNGLGLPLGVNHYKGPRHPHACTSLWCLYLVDVWPPQVLTYRSMGKRRWIRDRDWQRQPHVKDGPPPSLWWYRRPDHLKVVDAYLEQYSHGRTVSSGFRDQILRCLRDLSEGLYLKDWGHPRTWRYWSIPSYAATHGIKRATLMKRLRELEKVAIRLFRDSVPSDRLPRGPLSEHEIKRDSRSVRSRSACEGHRCLIFHTPVNSGSHLPRPPEGPFK